MMGAEKADFYSVYRLVTLKIRSRSPKSNQLFIVSHIDTIYQFLFRIHHLVQEIMCGNEILIKNRHFKVPL